MIPVTLLQLPLGEEEHISLLPLALPDESRGAYLSLTLCFSQEVYVADSNNPRSLILSSSSMKMAATFNLLSVQSDWWECGITKVPEATSVFSEKTDHLAVSALAIGGGRSG